MSDPMRLIDGDTNEFERMLLGAVAHEQPSRWQRHRMRRAVWLTRFGILGSALNALANFGPHGIGTILLSTSLVVGASTPIEPTQATERTNPVLTPTAAKAKAPSREPSAPAAAPTTTASVPSVENGVAPTNDAAATPTRSSTTKLGTSTRGGAGLREEIVLLDQARTALRQGQASRTLAAVDQYRSSFPRGAFDQEAAVLRVEALQSLGNRTRAVAEANAFLARNPNSPHGDRVRRVLAQNGANRPD
ncbi:MAG TPA: tetratricopeptide repeat protein [Polyangiaceae bacterium]